MKEQRTKHYEKKTVKDIVGEIASRHGLSNDCTGTIAQLKLDRGQTEVSDAHFLQTLADEHDCVFAVKDDKLTFKKKGENIQGFAIITHPGNVMSYSLSFQDRNAHGQGGADWWDRKAARRQRSKSYGSSRGGRHGASKSSVPSRSAKLHTNGKSEADDAAKSRVAALSRAELKLNMTIVGDPSFRAEMILVVAGVRAGVDGSYRIKSVIHALSNEGYRTNLEAEGLA
jgi:phage protein D